MAEWPAPLFPCRILPSASPSVESAIPLRIFNPDTQTTETAALVVDVDENETLKQDLGQEGSVSDVMNATVSDGAASETVSHILPAPKIKQEAPPPVALPQLDPLNFLPPGDMSLPVPYSTDAALLVSSQISEDFAELKSGHTVGVYFSENGEARVVDDSMPPTDPNDSMNTALWNAYLTGLYNGLSLASGGEMRQGRPLFWSPPRPPHHLPAFPSMTPIPKHAVHEARLQRPHKKPRRSKYCDRSCRNCGTKSTPFWRKDRYSGEPLCNAYIQPKFFGPQLLRAIEDRVRTSVEGVCLGKYGYCVSVTQLREVGRGLIRADGTGYATFNVHYDCIVLRPFRGQVLDMTVREVMFSGFVAEAGPVQVFVSSHVIPESFTFVPDNDGAFESVEKEWRITAGTDVRVKILRVRVETSDIACVGTLNERGLGLSNV